MADNQVTTDFIADTTQLEAAAMTASAALANYEKASKTANDAAAAAVDQYEKTAAAAHAKVGSAVKLAARDTDQYAKSVANATWQVKALTTAQMKRTLPTPQLPPVQYAPVRRESPNSFTAADLVMDKVDAAAKRATTSVAVFGETSRRASYQASAGFDNTAGRVTQLHRSITAMQKGLRLGGGLIASLHALSVGASLIRGDFEDAAEQVKQLPFGIGTAATALENVLGYATGFKQQTDAANKAYADGNALIDRRAEILAGINQRAAEADRRTAEIGQRKFVDLMVSDDIRDRVVLAQKYHAELERIAEARAKEVEAAGKLHSLGPERVAKLNTDISAARGANDPARIRFLVEEYQREQANATARAQGATAAIEALDKERQAVIELHRQEMRSLEFSHQKKQEDAAAELDARLVALGAVDEEERRIFEAKLARTNAVAEAEQAVLDIQLSNQRRGIQHVTAEEQRAKDIVIKTKAVQDAMVSAVEREVAERRKATEESRRQAEAVLDARLATEQLRAGGMGATADVYAQTQSTRDELGKARADGDTAKVEKLVALLSAELQVIGNAAQKQSDDAANALQEMLASQQRIEVKSVEQASADFRMQEVMAREQKQNIDKQVKATQAVEKRTVEVRDAVKAIKLEAGYGP